ncbi:MAG: PqqD family protein [Candidatus Cryptobacteroides sp.]
MKFIEGFVLREIAGQAIITGEGIRQINFNKLLSLNETAAWLWKQLDGKSFTVEDVAKLLEEEYEISHETATADAASIVSQWTEAGVIE